MEMIKWKITIILKSGKIVKGIYESGKTNSLEVAREMLPERKPTNVFGFKSEDGNKNVFVMVTEVSAFDVGL